MKIKKTSIDASDLGYLSFSLSPSVPVFRGFLRNQSDREERKNLILGGISSNL